MFTYSFIHPLWIPSRKGLGEMWFEDEGRLRPDWTYFSSPNWHSSCHLLPASPTQVHPVAKAGMQETGLKLVNQVILPPFWAYGGKNEKAVRNLWGNLEEEVLWGQPSWELHPPTVMATQAADPQSLPASSTSRQVFLEPQTDRQTVTFLLSRQHPQQLPLTQPPHPPCGWGRQAAQSPGVTL